MNGIEEPEDDPGRTRRILVIDDNASTQQDFQKILARRSNVLDDMESLLFGQESAGKDPIIFEIDCAFQGQDGLEMVQHKMLEGKYYDLAFVDLRMPPGWDGIETILKIWELDPLLQIVLCAAYLGQSRAEVTMKLGRSEGLSILPKPFEAIQVLDLANGLTEQCRFLRQSQFAHHP